MPARPAIHQLTPTLAWGDAVGNQVRLMRRWFADAGYDASLYAGRTDEGSRGEARDASDLAKDVRRGDLVLVHHSIQSRFVPLLRQVAKKRAKVIVVFHNVTPPELLRTFDAATAAACEAALAELRELSTFASGALAYSEFSAHSLREAGFPEPRVVPYPLDFSAFNVKPEPTLRAELSDGCTNVLFVGRGSPNKRIEAVLRVFTAYQRLYQPRSRLVLAGGLDREHPYGAWVHAVRETLSPERVHLLGRVSPEQLSACFETAHVYLSMSAHEGFGVPLIEAMHRGVPVVAHDAGAVAETLGGAGWVCSKDDPLAFARLLAVLDREPATREKVIARGRRRARDFDEEFTRKALFEVLE